MELRGFRAAIQVQKKAVRGKCVGFLIQTGKKAVFIYINGDFLKWWYPKTMGFPTKNDRLGGVFGVPPFRENTQICKGVWKLPGLF